MDAADEKAFAAPGRQQLDRVGDARGPSGEHHDAVGGTMNRYFLGRYAGDEPEKTGDEENADREGREHDQAPQAADHPDTPRGLGPQRCVLGALAMRIGDRHWSSFPIHHGEPEPITLQLAALVTYSIEPSVR